MKIDGSTYAYAVSSWTASVNKTTVTAYFKNADRLGDMTATVDGEEVTGKVFFRMSDGSTYKIYKAVQQSDGGWSCQVPDSFTSIRVLYKAADTETTVDIEGTELTFDGKYSGDTGGDGTLFDWKDLTNQITQSASQSTSIIYLMSAP